MRGNGTRVEGKNTGSLPDILYFFPSVMQICFETQPAQDFGRVFLPAF